MRHHLLRIGALVVGICVCLTLLPSIQTFAQSDQRCFPETGFCISGRIRTYWEQNGGLPVFGYPITDQHPETIEGKPFQVQWFERNRLELHPENNPPYDVLLGRLGVDRLQQQGRDWATFPKVSAAPGDLCFFSSKTGHVTCSDFFLYFRQHGLNLNAQAGYTEAESIALFGLPLSEPQMEVNAADGKEYLTQWFERARFEYHPENQPPYNVLLGLLGNEVRGAAGNPPPTAIPATPTAGTPAPSPTATANPVTGRLLFVSDREDQGEIYTMRPDGSNVKRLTNKAANYFAPSWSPDGSKIVFGSDRDGGKPEIYTMDADGSFIVRLTDNDSNDISPTWSSDGSKIAFATDRDGNYEIYVMNASGSGVTRLTSNDANDVEPAWSPDGTKIAFSSERDLSEEQAAESDIYIMNTNGSSVKRLSDHRGGDREPAWSPDGKRIAFSVSGYGMAGGDVAGGDIFLINTDGSNLVQLTPDSVGGRHPTWSPDGSKLAFASARNDDALFDLFTIGVDGSNVKKLTKNPGSDYDPSWSRS